MELKHIDIEHLSVSAANMSAKGKAPDIANILPSVRARGILVPLIVRPGKSEGMFEIVAGKRRYHAALAILEEAGGFDPIPCAIIEAGDDAGALEASLIENVARLDPDEVARWESFTRLVKEGRSAEEIALTFGLTELQVKRTLALGNLAPRIRSLYGKGEIDAMTVRHLTLASRAQQREWLAMLDDPKAYCPTGSQLKAWLFGGMSIPVSAAIFDLSDYDGEIVSDLFGDERYFASVETFWAAQRSAVEKMAESYREKGWREVVILEPGQYFSRWEYEQRTKAKGGKVIIAIGHRGDVEIHEGLISSREARALERGDAVPEKPKRAELSAALSNYADLHRHAVVRAAVAADGHAALRLMLAHAIHGSALWSVRIEPQHAQSDAIAEGIETCASETAFDERRREVLAALGFDQEAPTVTRGDDGPDGISGLFLKLMAVPDETVLQALAIVMAETLDTGTALIETLGRTLAVDMGSAFAADEALVDLLKDRELLDAMLAEIAGEEAAAANGKATGKVKRQIIADCLKGENGRAKAEGFVPRFMAFPPSAYTERGGVATVSRAASIEHLFGASADGASVTGDLDEAGADGVQGDAMAEQLPSVAVAA